MQQGPFDQNSYNILKQLAEDLDSDFYHNNFSFFVEKMKNLLKTIHFTTPLDLNNNPNESILMLLTKAAVNGKPDGLLTVLDLFGTKFTNEDLTTTNANGENFISVLWQALKPNELNQNAYTFFNNYLIERKDDNFINFIRNLKHKLELNQRLNLELQHLRKDPLRKQVEYGHYDELLPYLMKHQNSYIANDFTESPLSGIQKGISTLMLLAKAAVNGQSEALLFVLKRYGTKITNEEFTTPNAQGESIISVLCPDLKPNESKPKVNDYFLDYLLDRKNVKFLDFLEQNPGAFTDAVNVPINRINLNSQLLRLQMRNFAENGNYSPLLYNRDVYTTKDFTELPQTGTQKGISTLMLLTKSAVNGQPDALLAVLKLYGSAFTLEDFKNENANGESVLSVLQIEFKTKSEVLNRIFAMFNSQNLEKFNPSINEVSTVNKVDVIEPSISGGVSDKYLNPQNRTNLKLPKPDSDIINVNQRQNPGYIFECLSLEKLSAQLPKTATPHKKQIIQIADSQLSFYSHNLEVNQDTPCVFIMAGRKNNAHFLKPSENVRTILVFCANDLKELTHPIPASLDYLVIEKLHSSTHGEFKPDELGLLTPRRLAAFLFAHHYMIDHCIVFDDNINKIKLTKAPTSSDSSYLYQTMLNLLNNSLSVNIQTISNNMEKELAKKNKLGSKIFAFNMRSIRKRFPEPENLFYLLPPSSCVRWWGEDYIMQCMLHEVAQSLNQGFRTLTLDEFGGLYRHAKHQNSCKKVVSTAEDYVNKTDVFLNGIDFSKIEGSFINHIQNSLSTVKKIVQNRIDVAAQSNNRLAQLDHSHAHAKANNVEIITNYTRPISNLSNDKVFSTSRLELDKLDTILYKHQFNALKILLESKEPIGHMAMCTGAGKTRDEIAFVHLCSTKMRNPIFIIAPTRELVKQTYNEFISTHDEFSVYLKSTLLKQHIIKVSSSKSDLNQMFLSGKSPREQNVFIFCVDSFKLFMKSDRYFDPSALIFDEYHSIPKETISTAIGKLQRQSFVPVIGLSATPVNDVKHPLSKCLFTYSREEALNDGRVAPIIIDAFKTIYSEESYQEMLSVMPGILKSTFHPNGKLLYKKKGIIFVKSIKDADILKESIENKLDIPVFAIHSKVNNNAIIKFKKCSMAVAIAVQKLRVGFDDPTVNYVIDLQNPQNADIFTQIVGRTMRVTPLDPTKIGYVIAFKDPNTCNFKVTTDAIALEKASAIYKLKQKIGVKLKKYSEIFEKLLLKISSYNSNIEFKKILNMPLLNKFLDMFEHQFNNFLINYKNNLKISLPKEEYQRFKRSDNLFLTLKEFENELIPNNQRLYEEPLNNKENKPYFVSDFCNSISDIGEELNFVSENELISINKTWQSRISDKRRA